MWIIAWTGHIFVGLALLYIALMAAIVFLGPDEPSGLFYDEKQ